MDLSELPKLSVAVDEAGLDSDVPTLSIAEVVLTSMANSSSGELSLVSWAVK